MASSSLFLRFIVPVLLLSLQFASPSHARSHRKISLGSSLTPLGRNTFWLSPSGEFAFGFHPLEQPLLCGRALMLRLTPSCPPKFKLRLQDDGNLVLYTEAVPSGNQYDPYWASDTVGNGAKLVFNKSGRIYLALKNGSIFNFTAARILDSMKDFYHRATLDSDGVFRQYVYPRNGMRDASWTAVDFQPPDICQPITARTGSGACGYNSYCRMGDKQHVDCECLPQYSFVDPSGKYKGCERGPYLSPRR